MDIRPFEYSDKDYADLVTLGNLVDPEERQTVELLRQADAESDTGTGIVRWIGEQDAQVVAHGAYWRVSGGGEARCQFSMMVHPDYQSGGGPAEMQSHLLSEIQCSSPSVIASEPTEDQTYRVDSLKASGFRLTMRFLRSYLDTATFDYAAYDHLPVELARQGIELVTLTSVMQSDPDWQRSIWHTFSQIERDVPEPYPMDPMPFQTYAEYYRGRYFRPDSWMIAQDTNRHGAARYVGMCVVNIMPARPDALYTGIIGVLRSHRRRKIGTALKVGAVRYAYRRGYRRVYTDNEEHNPMHDLNMQLGSIALPASLYYEKETARS